MKLAIVDENDNLIRYKDRDEVTGQDIYRVARLLIINSERQILLAQRSLAKQKDPGLWGLAVEGTVEEGESYESNIRKEAEEEIGATLGRLELGPKLRMTGKYNHWCQFFVYRIDLAVDQLRLQQEELAMAAWFNSTALVREVAANPHKFGYRFELILEKCLPLLGSHATRASRST